MLKAVDPELIAEMARDESAVVITDLRKVRYILVATSLSMPEHINKELAEIEGPVDLLMPEFERGGVVMLMKRNGDALQPLIVARANDEDEDEDAPVTQSAE